MNKTIKLIGMIAFIAILAFSMVTCDNGGVGGNTPNPPPPPPPIGETVPGNNLKEKLVWVSNNAQNNKTYIIDVTKDEAITNTYYFDKNATVILRGGSAERIISLNSFIINNGLLLYWKTTLPWMAEAQA